MKSSKKYNKEKIELLFTYITYIINNGNVKAGFTGKILLLDTFQKFQDNRPDNPVKNTEKIATLIIEKALSKQNIDHGYFSIRLITQINEHQMTY